MCKLEINLELYTQGNSGTLPINREPPFANSSVILSQDLLNRIVMTGIFA